ncbi:MAG: DUF2892 domain-containing protein [Candidatus Pacearchaeota archaeon]|jgi:cell division protein FtsW (lipid II flippase)
MECNIGKNDKIIRVVVAVVLLLVGYLNRMAFGAWQYLLYVVAIILLVTVAIGFCLPYQWLGINTCKPASVAKSVPKAVEVKQPVKKSTKKKKR